MAETWRIVLADGTVREVLVRSFWYEGRHICWTADFHATGETGRRAVVRLASNLCLGVAEILAPGEPTRAELTAERDEAWTAGAEAMRRDCAKTCEQVAARQRASAYVPDTSARWSEGIADGADVCVTYVREVPIPTRPEVSRG